VARLNLFAEVLELPKRLFNVVVPGGTQDPLLLTGVAMAGLPREVVVAVVRVQARADPLKILLCLVVPLAVLPEAEAQPSPHADAQAAEKQCNDEQCCAPARFV